MHQKLITILSKKLCSSKNIRRKIFRCRKVINCFVTHYSSKSNLPGSFQRILIISLVTSDVGDKFLSKRRNLSNTIRIQYDPIPTQMQPRKTIIRWMNIKTFYLYRHEFVEQYSKHCVERQFHQSTKSIHRSHLSDSQFHQFHRR